MRRSTVRFAALLVLALLGVPVAMHVVLHDLSDHHAAPAHGEHGVVLESGDHGDHEHPIVASPAPQVLRAPRTFVPALVEQAPASAIRTGLVAGCRNVLAFGAVRTDTDVGLQPFLSVFLI